MVKTQTEDGKLLFEVLEPRLLLSADLDGGLGLLPLGPATEPTEPLEVQMPVEPKLPLEVSEADGVLMVASGGEAKYSYLYGNNGTDVSIPDMDDWVSSAITTSGAPAGSGIVEVAVYLDIQHTYIGDLRVDLMCYDPGTDWIIHNRTGGSADDIVGWFYNDTQFDGLNPDQDWALWARDEVGGDVGYINYWAIYVYYGIPDLADRGDAYSTFTPQVVWEGQAWECHWDVSNIGDLDAGSFWVDYYISTNSIISAGDTRVGMDYISDGVAAGSYADSDLYLSSFPNVLPRDYYVGVIIDATSAVTESNESNNNPADYNYYPLIVDDAYEQNNTLATAYDLSGYEQTWLTDLSGYGRQLDQDWYEIYITPGYERLLVDLTFSDAAGDIDIAVYDSGGAYVTSATSISDDEHIDYVLPDYGTYYLKVYYGNAGNNYNMWWDDIQPPEWTVMVYMNAESLTPEAVDDINEMEVVDYGDDLSVVVLVDYDGNNDTYRGLITHDTNPGTVTSPLVHMGEFDMGDPDNLENFIVWGESYYRAQKYALVLWDHGGGFAGFGSPEGMSMQEVRQAVTNAGVDFEVIGYDACLMGMAEVAYDLRDFTDMFVASEAGEPLDGWQYDTALGPLNSNPTWSGASFASNLVTSYGNHYGPGGGQTLSAIDASDMNALATELDDFADIVLAQANGYDWIQIRAARDAARCYDSDPTHHLYRSFRDLGEFMDGVVASGARSSIRTAASAVLTALGNAVAYNYVGTGTSGQGLTIYLPDLGDTVSGAYSSTNLLFVADTDWDLFVQDLVTAEPDLQDDGDIYSSFSPTTVAAGDAWECHFDIRNDGDADAGGFYVDFYASTNTTITTLDYYLGYVYMSGIAATDWENCDLSVSSFPQIPAGDYYVGIIIDSTDTVAESDEGDNIGLDLNYYPLTVVEPDLVGASFDVVPDPDDWSESFDVNWEVTNQGLGNATGFWVGVYLSLDTDYDAGDPCLDGTWVSGLAAGASTSGTMTAVWLPAVSSLPSGWPTNGPYYLVMFTDDYDSVVESDETNNHGQGWMVDSDDIVIRRVDLYDDGDMWSWFNPDAVEVGDEWWCGFDIANSGPDDSGAFDVDFYASVNDTISPSDYYLGSVRVTNVIAGGYANADLYLASFPDIPVGDYYVGILIDTGYEVYETDEANNTGVDYDYYPLTVYAMPDLIGTYFNAVPDPSAWGQAFDAEWEVTNQGRADAGAFAVGWYLSLDTDYDVGDPLIGWTNLGGLAAGASTSGTTPLTMVAAPPGGWPTSGPYYIVMYTDDLDSVTESDETNNHGQGYLGDWDDINIGVTQPDLEDRGDAYSWFSPQVVQPGVAFEVSFDVANTGDADAVGFNVDFGVSTDAVINTSDYWVGETWIPGVAAGDWETASGTFSFPSLPAGKYYVGAIIDLDGFVPESDEANNTGVDLDGYPLIVALAGDANFDGCVTGADYTLWADNYLMTGADWEDGDFNLDGQVTGADYTLWADNYLECMSGAGEAVPSPAALEPESADAGFPRVEPVDVLAEAVALAAPAATADQLAAVPATDMDVLVVAEGNAARATLPVAAAAQRPATDDSLSLLEVPSLVALRAAV